MSQDKFNSDFAATPEAIEPSTLAKRAGPGRCRRLGAAFSLSWAAGFADGEGCIYIFKQPYAAFPNRHPTYRLGFSITQNDRQVLEHFKEGIGIHGGLYEVKRVLQHNRQIYELKYTGINALKVIAMLQPYLIRKQIEAQIALAYWTQGHGGEHPGPRGWPASIVAIRERLCQKLKSLK
jgi:hypothetical protein